MASKKEQDQDLSRVGRSDLIKLVGELRREVRVLNARLVTCEAALKAYHERLDFQEKRTDSNRLDGIYLAGFRCGGCGVFNSDEKERRADCRACGMKRT